MVQAVNEVIKELKKQVPHPPVVKRRLGQIRRHYSPDGPTAQDLEVRQALVRQLRRKGLPVKTIARCTRHSRGSVYHWIRTMPDSLEAIAREAELARLTPEGNLLEIEGLSATTAELKAFEKPRRGSVRPTGHPRPPVEEVKRVEELRKEGMTPQAIARQTGHGRTTVRNWLMGRGTGMKESDERAESSDTGIQGPPPAVVEAAAARSSTEEGGLPGVVSPKVDPQCGGVDVLPPPPKPWRDWEQIRTCRQLLRKAAYVLVCRNRPLGDEQKTLLQSLFEFPIGPPLKVAHDFAQHWYGIWWDEEGERRTPEEAGQRWKALKEMEEARTQPALKRFQERMTDERFKWLSHFLSEGQWESTDNGSERMVHQIRHLQSSHFKLRNPATLSRALRVMGFVRMEKSRFSGNSPAVGSTRGRPLKSGGPRRTYGTLACSPSQGVSSRLFLSGL